VTRLSRGKVHGLIHLIGTAKAFGVADIPQLTQQMARPLGILWLLAAALFLLAAILLFTWPQRWWVVGAGAVVVSRMVIVTSWSDARYGTIARSRRAWVEPSQRRSSPRPISRKPHLPDFFEFLDSATAETQTY